MDDGESLFGFDGGDRLVAMPGDRELAYDGGGQLSTLSIGSSGSVTSYAYDSKGNRTSELTSDGDQTSTASMGYNAANQLTSLIGADGTAYTYVYDGVGLRVGASSESVSGAVSEATYVWDATAPVPLLLMDDQFAYVYGVGGSPLAQVRLDGDAVTYLHGDTTGSVRMVTDSEGDVVCDADYDAYGLAAEQATATCAGVTRFGFAGEYADENGFVYLRARWYDPLSGQFLSVDPLVDVTWDPYGYASGNPVQLTDPLGLFSFGDALDYVRGAATGAWSMGMGMQARSPASMLFTHDRYSTAVTGDIQAIRCDSQTEGVWSAANIHLNPACQVLDAGDVWVAAVRNGDYEAAGEAAVRVTVAEASLVATATGITKAGSMGLSAVRSGKGAANTAGEAASSSGRVFVGTSRGTIYDIPEGWVGRAANNNNKGIVYQRAGAEGNADMVRIMEPTPKYPDGYVRVYNSGGQPVDVFGKPGPPADTHIPGTYSGPWPGWPQ